MFQGLKSTVDVCQSLALAADSEVPREALLVTTEQSLLVGPAGSCRRCSTHVVDVEHRCHPEERGEGKRTG